MGIFCFYLSFIKLLLFISLNSEGPLTCIERILLFCISASILDGRLAMQNLLGGCRSFGIIRTMCILIVGDPAGLGLEVFSGPLCIRF